MSKKSIDGWLVIDWRNESHRTRKSKPSASDLGANEVYAKLSVDVTIPEVDVPTLSVDVDVPEPQVYAATLDAIDDDELPDWSAFANDVVAEYVDEIRAVDEPSGQELTELADRLTAKVLIDVETRPDPESVRSYVGDVVREVRDGDDPPAGGER